MAIVDIRLRPRRAIPLLPFAADNNLVQRLQSSVCPYRVQLHGPVQFTIRRSVRLVGHVSPKLPLPRRGSSPPRNTLFLGPSPLIIPNSILIGSAVFVWVTNAMLYNALSVGKKTPEIASFPWDFVTPPKHD